jgi:hypothetical protein
MILAVRCVKTRFLQKFQVAGVRTRETSSASQILPLHLSPRCGAHSGKKETMRNGAMRNSRSRMHGGKATGAHWVDVTEGGHFVDRKAEAEAGPGDTIHIYSWMERDPEPTGATEAR